VVHGAGMLLHRLWKVAGWGGANLHTFVKSVEVCETSPDHDVLLRAICSSRVVSYLRALSDRSALVHPLAFVEVEALVHIGRATLFLVSHEARNEVFGASSHLHLGPSSTLFVRHVHRSSFLVLERMRAGRRCSVHALLVRWPNQTTLAVFLGSLNLGRKHLPLSSLAAFWRLSCPALSALVQGIHS
jgi:hypothetical protein